MCSIRKTVRSDSRLVYNTIPWYGKTYTLHLLLINQNLVYSIPPISQFNSPCNEYTSVWSMFVYNNTYFAMNVSV